MALAIMIEGQLGLNWARWKRLVAEVEALGFAGLFRSDHFTNPRLPDQDTLEPFIWFDLDDFDALRAFANAVPPQV